MNKTVICGVSCLVAGIAIGFAISKMGLVANDSTSINEGKSDALLGKSEAASGLYPGSSLGRSSGRKSGIGSSGDAAVEALLELVDTTNSMFNRKLHDRVEQIGEGDFYALAQALAAVPQTDQRVYQVRNAVYARWARVNPDAAWDSARGFENLNMRRQLVQITVQEIARSDFARARELIDGMEEGQEKQQAVAGLTSVGAKEQPELMFEMLKSTGGQHVSWQYNQLFQQWARESPDVAIARLESIKGVQQRQQALNGVVQGLSAIDPERAIEFAKQIGNANERRNAMQTAVGTLAATDPQRAIALMDEMPSGNERSQMSGEIASNWMNTDPEAALQWIESLPPRERSQALNNSVYQLAQNSPEIGAKLLQELPPSSNSSHMFSNLANQWAQVDPKAAIAWARKLPLGASRMRAIDGIVQGLENNQPELAASILTEEGVTNQNSYRAGNIFGNWVVTDRDAAVAWLEQLNPGSETKRNIVTNALSNWTSHNPDEASAYVLKLEDEKLQKQAINSLVSNWGQNNPDAANEWVQANLQGEKRDAALSSLIQNLAHNDHTRALSLYKEAISGLSSEDVKKSFSSVERQIARAWSQHDAPGAAGWIMEQPEGDSRADAVESVVDTWSEYDPVGASEFVSLLPAGKERDSAVRQLVNNVKQSDPESAFIWAESITDESNRARVVRDAVRQWKETDPDAAFEAAGRANISDEEKINLLKSLQEQ